MEKSDVSTTNVKHSKALYTVAIYGFIALFFLMIYPFLPIYEGVSPFQSGISKFNKNVVGNLIVTISMLIHSVILLVVFIIMLAKIKNYRAGAGYSFYKLFKYTVIIFFLVFSGFNITGNISAFYESYGYAYWFIVCGVYGFGVLLSAIAQWSNQELHPSKAKILYYVLNFVMTVLLVYILSARANVAKYIIEEVNDYTGVINKYHDTIKNVNVKSIYGALISIMNCALIMAFAHLCMPLNSAFSYMYDGKGSRSKYSKLSFAGVNIELSVFVIFFFIFAGNELNYELLIMLITFLFVTGKYIFISIYNNRVSAKHMPQPVYTSKYFTTPAGKKPDASVAEDVGVVKAWSVKDLSSRNEHLDFKDKTTIDKMSDDLCAMLNDYGIAIEKEQSQKVLAGILSSKVTFIKCEPNRKLIKDFSSTISEFFGEETFFEERLNDEITLKLTQPTTKPVEKPIEQPEHPVSNIDNLSDTTSTMEGQKAENAQETSQPLNEVAVNVQPEDTPNISVALEEQDGNATSVQPIAIEETEEEKQKRLKIEERERDIKEKHSIPCGMFVAHYINNTFGMVFLNNTEEQEISESDADAISAIALGDETMYVGKQKFCPETEVYSNGIMKIADNVRLVVFISDKEETPLEREWIKYSTIVDLSLTENKEAERALELDCGTSYAMVNQSLEEAQETCYLTEEYWRKIDRMEGYLEEHTDIRFDNRLIRQMEKSIAAFIACGMDRKQALDAVLSEKIIPLVATEREKILGEHDADFSFKLDELFGFENIPLTKQAIANYGLKK